MSKRKPIEIDEHTNRVEAMIRAIGAMLDRAHSVDKVQAIVVVADERNSDLYSAVFGKEHELGVMLGNAMVREPRLLTINGLAQVCIAEQMREIDNNLESYEEDIRATLSRVEGIDEEYIDIPSKSNPS